MLSSYEGDPRKPNAHYGGGVYRRRIALHASPGEVKAELEDGPHGFRLRLLHDGEFITAVEPQAIRYPFTTCPGAVHLLQALLAKPLALEAAALRTILVPGNNCTHLYDLATLALAHAQRPCCSRVYDVEVPDERDGETSARVAVDGVSVHHWRVREHQLLAPQNLAGASLMSGFYRWVSQVFSGDQLQAAQVLQRGYFVSQARRYDLKNAAGRPASDDSMPQGSCYTYNHGVVENAVRTGAVRDFSDSPELLLKFLKD